MSLVLTYKFQIMQAFVTWIESYPCILTCPFTKNLTGPRTQPAAG